MNEIVLDVVKREKELRKQIEDLGTKNVILHLQKDYIPPSGNSIGKKLRVKALSIEFGAFYFLLRDDDGKLVLSAKTSVFNVERLERDSTEYPVFFYGGGHPE